MAQVSSDELDTSASESEQFSTSEFDSAKGSLNSKGARAISRAVKDLDGDDAKIIRDALEQLISLSLSVEGAIAVNRCIRHRDFAQGRRPYERLVVLLSSHFERDVVRAALGAINAVLAAPIPEDHHDALWFVLERAIYTENIKFLLKNRNDETTATLATFQRFYFKNLKRDAMVNYDPSLPRYDALVRKVNQCAEPLSSWSAPCLTGTLSVLSLKFLAYFGEVYGDLYRRTLDETEDCGTGKYPFTFACTHIARVLADVLCDLADQNSGSSFVSVTLVCADGLPHSFIFLLPPFRSSDPASALSAAEPVLILLFSSTSALPELFCIAFVVFDVTWKELHATLLGLDKVLDELRLRLVALITQFTSIRAIKEATGLLTVLAPTDIPKPKKSEPDKRELVADFNELLFDLFAASENLLPTVISKPSASRSASPRSAVPIMEADSQLDLLATSSDSSFSLVPAPSSADLSVAPTSVRRLPGSSASGPVKMSSSVLLTTEQQDLILDCIRAIQAVAGLPTFPWTYMHPELLAYILRCLTFGSWLRHPELSHYATVLLEFTMKKDPEGIPKFEEALRLLALDSNDALYRPIVKLIRNNRTFPPTLRILNKMFETKTKDKARTRFLAELQKVDAMSFLKSKVWTTSDDVRKELFKFQVMLLAIPEAMFDPSNAEHREMAVSIWEKTFPNLPLVMLSSTQFELLGFLKVKSMNDFSTVRTVCFAQLQALLDFQPDVFQHVVLYAPQPDEEVLPAGDIGIAITEALLNRFTKSDLILPVLFDSGYESLHEVYILVYLWVVQEWRANPTQKWPQLVESTVKQLAELTAKHKPVTIDELVQHIGLSFESIRTSWLRSRGRAPSLHLPSLPMGDLSAELDGLSTEPVSTNAAMQSAKLNKMLGVVKGANGAGNSPATLLAGAQSPVTPPNPETSRDWTARTSDSVTGPSVDLLDSYLLTHQAEFAERGKQLVKKMTKEIEGQRKARAKRSRTTREKESSSSEEDDEKAQLRSAALNRGVSKRLELVGGEKAFQRQLENLAMEEVAGGTVEQMTDAAWKRRKTEIKDQKELLKLMQAKHKAHQKKVLDELKTLSTQ